MYLPLMLHGAVDLLNSSCNPRRSSSLALREALGRPLDTTRQKYIDSDLHSVARQTRIVLGLVLKIHLDFALTRPLHHALPLRVLQTVSRTCAPKDSSALLFERRHSATDPRTLSPRVLLHLSNATYDRASAEAM
ncbi:hypothetical protein PsYK624_152370 [Phanerochaete sordida]|uniref:Uncharacterized protein n=1 Tax=Phanerochaete sordida TaxID=48140 RepID=A0A9P3GRG6_9APHY|nr:hypothetical protein PsYK624_152370 [Phanerochaete sordida]